MFRPSVIQPAALIVLMLGTACFRIELGDGPSYGGDFDVDQAVEEDLAAGNVAEASSWLQESGNMLFEGDPATVQKLIDDLYRAGAYNVWFTGIEDFGGTKVSASLAAEMPAGTAARAEMLRIEAEFWGVKPDPDKDQRYLAFYLD